VQPDVLVSHTSPELTWLATRGTGVRYVQYHNSPPFYIGERANPYMASRRYRRTFPAIRAGAAGNEAFARAPRVSARRRVEAEVRAVLKDRALRGARAVVVPSHRTARELRLLHGVEATVVRGCLPATLLESAELRAGAPGRTAMRLSKSGASVLSVSRLEPVKRIDLLLRAFAIVRRSVPESQLVIAGTGSEERQLRGLSTELGLDGCARFLGYVAEDELWELYASADVLAAPAMADFVIAPYEAMAMGCRAVWTTEMETDAAIEASGQVFVAPPEDAAFARAIVDALRAPVGRRADLRSMTWEARAERLEALLEDVAVKAAA
jgi:glycosyltransferase involved in cell wall biosynthesis